MTTLPATCDRAAAREMHETLNKAIGVEGQDDPLAIDASAVEAIGQAMLQVLLSAARTGAGIIVRQPSDAFIKTVRLAGLCEPLIEEDAA
ncbi:STAS domain-containing protein [Erythrobacter sp.]|jgi:anti-anti-sigma regulatory factor|uniref:STAS domain-containing protein n=1 Tax=Erythrobacter sp. TaxID=1042 RepID=UPI002EB3436F|nr:STAS domain-containing protein [Erythrobacter sp.]